MNGFSVHIGGRVSITLQLVLIFVPFTRHVGAADLRFRFSGDNVSGTIGDRTFEAATFEITAFARSQDIRQFFLIGTPFGWLVESTVASIRIQNIGEAVFEEPTGTFVNNAINGVGFFLVIGDGDGEDFLSLPCAVDCGHWNLKDPLGPFTTPMVDVVKRNSNTATSLGPLTLTTDGFNGRFEFQIVPEPVPIALLSTAVLFWPVVRRRRRCAPLTYST